MKVGHWTQLTLFMIRQIGSAVVLVLCLFGRTVLEPLWRVGASGEPKVLTTGNCTINAPVRQLALVDGQTRSVRKSHLHCPPALLNSLGKKGGLQCADLRVLVGLAGIGHITAGRVFEYRQTRSWSRLKQSATLSERQIQVLKRHFVLTEDVISCSS